MPFVPHLLRPSSLPASVLSLLLLPGTLVPCRSAEPVHNAVPAATAVPVTWKDMYVEGGDAAPAKLEPVQVTYQGKTFNGVRMTLVHGKSWNAVRFPTAVSALKYNTLQFKILTQEPDATANFGVQVSDQHGNWDATNLRGLATPLGENWRQFSWDIVNQPNTRRGADLGAIKLVAFRPAFPSIPEGKTVTYTLIDMKFVSGLSVQTGDPELFKTWQEYISAYKPDYSDSSRFLLPPAAGRILAPIALTRKGQARASIVMPAAAPAPVALGGRELRYWLKQISGAELPLVTAAPGSGLTGSSANARPKIFLGREFAAGKFAADLKWLSGSDGYAVRTAGSDVYIFGATHKGTLNGVFAFLENNTDIIWSRPRLEYGTVFTANPALDMVWANAREKPVTRLRGWATNMGLRTEHEIWSVRNGNNYPTGGGTVAYDASRRAAQGGFVEFGGGHNLQTWVPKDRPEFFPTIDGKKPEALNVWKHQICFTHPELPAVYTANLLKYLKEKAPPGIDCMNVKIEDNWGLCQCERCLRPITLPDKSILKNTDEAFRSTQFFLFLNQIQRGVNKVYPDLKLGTYAYFFTATTPKIPVDPHIRIYFCPYVRKDHRSPLSAPINAHWWNQLTAWSAMTPNVVIREYYGIMNGFRPLAEVVAFDVRSYVPRGVAEYTAELNPDEAMLNEAGAEVAGGAEWDFMAMEFWVINRLYWNPNQNVEQLRKYYLRRTYHEAAPAMERFFGTIRTAWYKMTVPSDFTEADGLMRNLVIANGLEDELRKDLDDAAASVRLPASALNVSIVRHRFEQWLRWAKDRAAKVEEEKISVPKVLTLGWAWNNDWGGYRGVSTATTLYRDGAAIPAVRFTVLPQSHAAGPASIRLNSFAGVKTGETLSLVITPAQPLAATEPLSLVLTATDGAGARIQAPVTALERRADGSIKVQWKLESPPGTVPLFDAGKKMKLNLTLDGPALMKDEPLVFHLTDLEISPQVP